MLDKKISSGSSTGHSTADESQLPTIEADSASTSSREKNATKSYSFITSQSNFIERSSISSNTPVSSQKVQTKTPKSLPAETTSTNLMASPLEFSSINKEYYTLYRSKDSIGTEDEPLFNDQIHNQSFDDLPIIPGFHSDIDDEFNEDNSDDSTNVEMNRSTPSFDLFGLSIRNSSNISKEVDSVPHKAITNGMKKNEETIISHKYKSPNDHLDLLSSISHQELAPKLPSLNLSEVASLASDFTNDPETTFTTQTSDKISELSKVNSTLTIRDSCNTDSPFQKTTEEIERIASASSNLVSGQLDLNTSNNSSPFIQLNQKLDEDDLFATSDSAPSFENFGDDNNILGSPLNGKLSETQLAEGQNLDEKETIRHKGDAEESQRIYELDELNSEVVWVEPDGGWGWWVLLGAMIVNILIPGTVKSFGVLFIEFLEVFETSPSAAAWIPAISYFLYSSTGPFAGALAIKYSHRAVTIVGGILASAGLVLSYFADSIGYLYVSYGVVGGLGAGLVYPIGVLIVGNYFNKKRGLANGICTSGSALGSVLVPPFLRFLLEEYGYRYAVLIMGVLLLNVCLAALFYDPVEKHLKRKLVPKDVSATLITLENTPTAASSPCRTQGINIQNITSLDKDREVMASLPIAIPRVDSRDIRERRNSGGARRATFQIGQDTPQGGDSWSLRSIDMTSPLAVRLLRDELPVSPKIVNSGPKSRGCGQSSLESDTDILYTGSHYINGSGAVSIQPSGGASRSRINLSAIPEDDDTASDNGSRGTDWNFYKGIPSSRQRLVKLSMEQGNQLMGQNQQSCGGSLSASATQTGLARTMSIASNFSNSSFHYVSTIHHGSILMAMQYDRNLPQFASSMTLKSVGGSCWSCLSTFPKKCFQKVGLCKNERDVPDDGNKKFKESRKYFDITLLNDGFFIIMLLSTSMGAVGYTNFLILLPAYGLRMGFDKSRASLLLSYVAGFDFIGRIGSGALSDLKFIPRIWFFIIGLFFSGVTLAFLPLAQEYYTLAILCSCFGLASGTYIGVTTVILADKCSAEKLGSSYGITLFVNGILQLIGPPICGVVYEGLGKYEPIFVALGFILIFGASSWTIYPALEQYKALKVAREARQLNNRITNQNYIVRNEGPLVV